MMEDFTLERRQKMILREYIFLFSYITRFMKKYKSIKLAKKVLKMQ